MAGLADFVFRGMRRRATPATPQGVGGTPVYGGVIVEPEKDPALAGQRKFTTFSNILANVSIVAAGTRYFTNLIGASNWTVVASDSDTDGRFAELVEKALMEDPATPLHRITRRASMYRFHGFSFQEWSLMRAQEGHLTFEDIEPRPQSTVQLWDVDTRGRLDGVTQQHPSDFREVYLPRSKCLYMCDDTLTDSPAGLGLFRHMVFPARRLQRYETFESDGLQNDLRGVPVARMPFAKLDEAVKSGKMTVEQRAQAEAPLRSFLANHNKGKRLSVMIESITAQTTDEKGTPSSNRLWDLELLKGGAVGLEDVANAITRLNYELARIMGVQGLLAGSGGSGSLALSKDQTESFHLIVQGSLREIEEGIAKDLVDTLFRLNGWPEEMKPKVKAEAVRMQTVEEITKALADMARAGYMLDADDPAINAIRAMLALPPVPVRSSEEIDAGVRGNNNEPDPPEVDGLDDEGIEDEDEVREE